ncbi:MAG: folate-binding protein YgfZ [Hydrogenophilaceae bacterium]|nr:folate-binding protein YgfZ [Hydrogenophilaceae bacterium]
MIPDWQDFLTRHGARIENAQVRDFGNPKDELASAQTGTVMADLSQLGLLAFSGEDVTEFLQNQFTNDVRHLHADGAAWNGYCSAKGRLLANFLMWKNGADNCLQMSGDIREEMLKRLKMFILRSKVKGRDATDENVRLVLSGPGSKDALNEAGLPVPGSVMKSSTNAQGQTVRIGEDKFVLVVTPEHAPVVWKILARHARPVGTGVWDWLRLANGIPMITAATKEEFVPQMINWEVLGGVSFQKGCYPGQEIVARTQYLGKLKRRMYLAHIDSNEAPLAGDVLYSSDMDGQASGMVVNAAPAPEGGFDLLAVAQIESVASNQPIHWKSADGPVLALKPQPYALP